MMKAAGGGGGGGGGMVVVDDNMSNLTSASNDASNCSGNRIEFGCGMYSQPHLASSPSTPQTQPAPKKKRNLPGNPERLDPEAEVIALSPRTLLATNRFVCEICNKGFQRDQNLQLHRRGHNLPWKLKQRNKNEVVRRKVYVCPETSCVHHDPSRALGDLTGIKKHFSRKHGEKKWKCEKCSKRYAVQSDWKAHSKICGTREYRCDCGTLFSRRDSFITHRAFCDALAEETARSMTTSNPLNIHQQNSSSNTIQLNLPINPLLLHNAAAGSAGHGSSAGLHHLPAAASVFPLKREQELQHGFNFPPWLANLPPQAAAAISRQEHFNPNPNSTSPSGPAGLSSFQGAAGGGPSAGSSPHMSATALLQKAAQIGVTMSNKPSQEVADQQAAHMNLGFTSRDDQMGLDRGFFLNHQLGLASFGNKNVVSSGCMDQELQPPLVPTDHHHHHHGSLMGLMSSFSTTNPHHHVFEGDPFGESFGGIKTSQREGAAGGCGSGGGTGNDGLTRDFLSLKVFPQREFINMDDLHHQIAGSSYEQHQNPPPWQS